ncbi:MAG: recombinase family protein [Candidatus Omnitrophota bacterium]
MSKDKIDALYCRVSTDMQREKGESIRNQKERLTLYAKEHNLNPQFYIDDGISAKDTKRPALQQLIEDIKGDRVSMVLVTKIDRITRNLKDLINLIELFEDYSVSFKSLTQPIDTSTAMGRGQVQLMGVFGQMEREMTSERVGEDMRHRARSGKWNGGVVPFGYMAQTQQVRLNLKADMKREQAEQCAKDQCPINKKLYVHEEEADVIRQIFDKYLETESLRAVTHWLNTKKYASRYGGNWAANSVSRVLRSPFYVGQLIYNKRVSAKATGRLKQRPKAEWIISDAEHTPIISREKFDRVQSILQRQAVEPRRKRSEYLLAGLVKCGTCGARMQGSTMRKTDGKEFSYYKCSAHQQKGATACTGLSANRHILEEAVVSAITKLYQGKQMIELEKAHELYKKKQKFNVEPLWKEKKRLEVRNEEIARKKKVLLERLEDETITSDEYKTRQRELEDELERNRNAIFQFESQLNDLGIGAISMDVVLETLKDFKKIWRSSNIMRKKELLDALISKVVYTDAKTPIKLELFFLDNCKGLLPHGQGFIAATKRKSAGNVIWLLAREIVMQPSSSGPRNVSSASRRNSGSSSRKRTPPCESDISPGRGDVPPPVRAIAEAV